VLFSAFFAIFRSFYPLPHPLSPPVNPSWKRLNSAIFWYFLLIFGFFFRCPPTSQPQQIFCRRPWTLNPNFLNLTIKIFALDTFLSHFLTFFCKKVARELHLLHPFQSPLRNAESLLSFKNQIYSWISCKIMT